jgi:hypothetical protein
MLELPWWVLTLLIETLTLRAVIRESISMLSFKDDFHSPVFIMLPGKFLQAVEDAAARAFAYPLAASPAQNRKRRVFLRNFPFALAYRSVEQAIPI